MMDDIAALLRQADPAQFFATLFVPQEKRQGVMAVRAFAAEMARIPLIVSEPGLGEIRFQWWREVISGERAGEAASHPLAAALRQTITTYRLPTSALEAMIDARVGDLYADPPPSLNDLEGYCGESFSIQYRLAALILSPQDSSAVADVAGHGGVAEGLLDCVGRWPLLLRRSRVMVPQDMMAEFSLTRENILAGTQPAQLRLALEHMVQLAEEHRAKASAALRGLAADQAAAFLPLALLKPLSAQVRRAMPDRVASLPQWRVQFELWRASRRTVGHLF